MSPSRSLSSPCRCQRVGVHRLDADRAALAGQPGAGPHQLRRHDRRHRHGQLAAVLLQAQPVEHERREALEEDPREAVDAHADAAGADDDLVAEGELIEHVGREVDDDVLGEPPALAGDGPLRALGVAGHDDGLVADAGEDVERLVGRGFGGLDRHARLDHVAGPAVDGIPELDVVDDAAQDRQQARSPVAVDLMGDRRDARIAGRDDHPHHRHRDQPVLIRCDHAHRPPLRLPSRGCRCPDRRPDWPVLSMTGSILAVAQERRSMTPGPCPVMNESAWLMMPMVIAPSR